MLLIEDDPTLAETLFERLSHEGHAVRMVRWDGGDTEVPAEEDALLILQLDRPAAGHERQWPQWGGHGLVPVIYVGPRDDMAARLTAQRAGATRFISQPVDMDRLLLLIDSHLLATPQPPYRVLLVAEDAGRLTALTEALRSAGMQVELVHDPMLAHAEAVRVRPECLVLSRRMQACSGDEVAAVLRADARFQDLPIVFLLDEGDVRPLPALDGAGEHGLPQTAAPQALVTLVSQRVRRVRSLRRVSEDLRASLREARMLRLALDVHAMMCITDADGLIAYVNDAFCRALGYRRRELLGRSLLELDAAPASGYSAIWPGLASGEVWRGPICHRRKDGLQRAALVSIVPYLNEAGVPTRHLLVGTDLDELPPMPEACRQAG
ncbi:MAG: PAS domain-containing protein [Thiobacillaceae bacterium]|nr:PAS domain-containing protein [Thiobacillaceae bacterium]